MVDERTKKLVEQSSAPIVAVNMEPSDDIVQERQKASFDSQQLARHLYGGQQRLDTRSISLFLGPVLSTCR